jgi:hypothetical protein
LSADGDAGCQERTDAESLADRFDQWQQAVPELVHIAFHSPSPEQRNLARGALLVLIDTASSPGRIQEQLKEAYEQGGAQEKYFVLLLLGEMGPDASPSVAWLLRHMRARAVPWTDADIRVMGRIGQHQTVVPELLRLCRETDNENTKNACLATLGTLGAREAVPLLLTRLQSPQSASRAVAARALGDIGSQRPAVLDGLCASVQDPDEKVRVEAIASLGRLRAATDEVVAAMDAGLRDDSAAVQEAAIVAVGRVGVADKKVLLRLCSIASDDVGARRRIRRTMSLLHGPSRATLMRLFDEESLGDAKDVVADALAISSFEGARFLASLIESDTQALTAIMGLEKAKAFPDVVAVAAERAIALDQPFTTQRAIYTARVAEAASPALVKRVSGLVADETVEADIRREGIFYLAQLRRAEPLALNALRSARDSTNQQIAKHAAAALKDMPQAGP